MGLFSNFSVRPSPRATGTDVADDRLAALGDMDVLDRHLLLALRAIFLQSGHLRCEGPGELVVGIRGAILLREIVHMSQAAAERHRRHMNRRHLSSEHRLDLIARLDALNHREHEIDGFFGWPLSFAGINELQHQTIAKV
jgi:hypothetical protein